MTLTFIATGVFKDVFGKIKALFLKMPFFFIIFSNFSNFKNFQICRLEYLTIKVEEKTFSKKWTIWYAF